MSAFGPERKRVEWSAELMGRVVEGSIAVELLHMGIAADLGSRRSPVGGRHRHTGRTVVAALHTCRIPVDPVEVVQVRLHVGQTTVLVPVGTRKLPG